LLEYSLARAECLTLTLSLGVTPANIAINDVSLKTRFFGLHFRCRKYCIFNHFYVIRPETTELGEITRRLGLFAVQGHPRSPSLLPMER